MGLDLAQLVGPQPAEALDTVGDAAPVQLVEARQLLAVERDDQPSARLERDPALGRIQSSFCLPSMQRPAFSEPGL